MGKSNKEGAGFEVVNLEKDRCKKIRTLPGVGADSASDLVVRRAWKPNGLTLSDILETCPGVTRERWILWIEQGRVIPDLRLRPDLPLREDLTNMEETCLKNTTPSFLAVIERSVGYRDVPAGPSDGHMPTFLLSPDRNAEDRNVSAGPSNNISPIRNVVGREVPAAPIVGSLSMRSVEDNIVPASPMENSFVLASRFEPVPVNSSSNVELKEEVSQLKSYIAEIHKVLIEQEQEKVKDKLDLSQTIQSLRSQNQWVQEHFVPYQVHDQNMAEIKNEFHELCDQSIKDRDQVLDQFQEAVTRIETLLAESIRDHQGFSQNQNSNRFDRNHDYSRDRNYSSGGFRQSNTPDRQYYTSRSGADVNGPGAHAYAESPRTYSAQPLMSTPYPGKTGPLPDPTFSRIPADSRCMPDYNFPSRAPTTRRVGYPKPYGSNRFYDNPDFSRSD